MKAIFQKLEANNRTKAAAVAGSSILAPGFNGGLDERHPGRQANTLTWF
jgi:hypothetical protein